ncbi:MAG: hypothetical protein ACEQSK_10215, partial [Sphingomonadaceae bacterium]
EQRAAARPPKEAKEPKEAYQGHGQMSEADHLREENAVLREKNAALLEQITDLQKRISELMSAA